jgi:hypothetical protein
MPNIAMLAKQAWRLLQDPESLHALSIRGYFLSRRCLEAKAKPGILYMEKYIEGGGAAEEGPDLHNDTM